MYKQVEGRLARLINTNAIAVLGDRRLGLEKESLRVSPTGCIAQTPHPPALGSALTHPYITTDYSEALLEFITEPHADIHGALDQLHLLHQFVYARLDQELLWSSSMPCVVPGETAIPIAEYGSSNLGKMKTVYRRGLGHRYGRAMQVIAGVHFNYSFGEDFWALYQDLEQDRRPRQAFVATQYFALLRNLQRYGWLIPYLFGASPAVCKSFVNWQPGRLQEWDANSYYEPYATSLRMGDIGYQNRREGETGVKACYDNLNAYVAALKYAIETPCPDYEKIGLQVGGEYQQLNCNILQIENEYYSTVRPKQVPQGNEKPIDALLQRGVRYTELRSLDINVFEPLGVNEDQLRFLEALHLFCLWDDPAPIDAAEQEAIDFNQNAAAHAGRDPRLLLRRGAGESSLRQWARELCEAMRGCCELLDATAHDAPYSRALETQLAAIEDVERTPSARILAHMRAEGEGFFAFAKRLSEQHRAHFEGSQQDTRALQALQDLAQRSREEQARLEAADTLEFGEFLRHYFAGPTVASARSG